MREKSLPFEGLVEHFAACMREQRGFSELTIRHRCWFAQKFLNWLDEQKRSFSEVSVQELDAFLSMQAVQGWSPSLGCHISASPAFLFPPRQRITPGAQRA